MEKDYGKIFATAAQGLSTASLNELNSLNLINRYDFKFLLNIRQINSLVDSLTSYFRILEIDNERVFNYENLYFDTQDNYFYKQHHNGKLNRMKIRVRRYSSSPDNYFEIKIKSNKSRVQKERFAEPYFDRELEDLQNRTALLKYNINPETLKGKLTVSYDRMTLVHNSEPVKITLDSNLYYKNCVNEGDLRGLVVAELKTDIAAGCPIVFAIMKNNGIRQIRLSKYCVGMVLLDPNIKYNRFKNKMLIINKLLSENNG